MLTSIQGTGLWTGVNQGVWHLPQKKEEQQGFQEQMKGRWLQQRRKEDVQLFWHLVQWISLPLG